MQVQMPQGSALGRGCVTEPPDPGLQRASAAATLEQQKRGKMPKEE